MRVRPARLALVAGVAVLVCGIGGCGSSPTSPMPPTMIVGVSGPATALERDTTINGAIEYFCPYSLTVSVAGGKPGTIASWGAGDWTVTSSLGTASGHYTSVSAFFDGVSTVQAGTYHEGAGLSQPVPFTLSQAFYYSTPGSSRDSASYTFTCQP